MKALLFVGFAALACSLLPGNSQAEPPAAAPQLKVNEAAITANLAKLSPTDRTLAESQKFCAIRTSTRLGTMGAPIKLMIQDKPVFLCCKGCQAKALASPDKTLVAVAELVKANAKPSADSK